MGKEKYIWKNVVIISVTGDLEFLNEYTVGNKVKCFHLGACLVAGFPSRGQCRDGEAVGVFSIPDLGLLHQAV